MQDESYNGWKNYPTWAVNLWLSNDEGLYLEALERTRETIENPPKTSEYWNDEETARFNVADMLKDWVTDELGVEVDNGQGGTEHAEQLVGFAADLYGYALGEVDWEEIANAWIESVSESEC